MPRATKGKKKAEKAKPAAAKPVGVWVWAQCDNAGCQKWRKLPPGTVIDDNEPWFCYMNPNEDRNDCNIPEEEYNAATEAAVYSHPVSEDEEESQDRSWTPVPEQKQHRSKGAILNGRSHPKGSPETGQKRSRQQRNGFAATGSYRQSDSDSLALRVDHEPAQSLEAHWTEEEAGPSVAEGRDGGANSPTRGLRKARQAHSGFNKLLAVGGAWEVTKGRGKAAVAPPTWIWEGLATHAPSGAQLACEAADASSAARYFELIQAPNGANQAQEAASTARLALTTAAALAVQETQQIPGIADSPPLSSSPGPGGKEGSAVTAAEADINLLRGELSASAHPAEDWRQLQLGNASGMHSGQNSALQGFDANQLRSLQASDRQPGHLLPPAALQLNENYYQRGQGPCSAAPQSTAAQAGFPVSYPGAQAFPNGLANPDSSLVQAEFWSPANSRGAAERVPALHLRPSLQQQQQGSQREVERQMFAQT